MAETLGTIRGQMILDIKQALASYTTARQAHISTVTALNTGAGALTAAGAAIAGVGALMAGGILVAVDAAAQFEKKLDYFAAISDSTQAEYDAIRQKALQLGADTIYSANQIADSFIELGKSGVGAKDIIGGIGEAVANLASATDMPLDTAANIVMAAVQTFGMAAEEAVGVVDKLAGAANASIIDVQDLGVSLKYAGGVAAALGIPFADLNTALALLGTYGIKGSTAGTSLRMMMLSLGGATPKATEALKELGIITADGANKFFDAQGKAKPLAEIFQTLKDATEGLTDKQKTSVLNTIFQNRALAAAIDLTREGADGFSKMAEAIDKTTALEVAGKRLDNLSGDIEVLKGNLDTLFIQSGSGFQEFARGIVQGVTDIVQKFIDLPTSVQTTILTILGVGGVILAVVGTMGMMAGQIMNLVSLFIMLKDALILWRIATAAATVAQWAMNVAMSANPIGIIVMAIAALVAGLIWFFTQTELGQEIWANFTQFLGEAWNNIVNFVTDAVNNVINFVTENWDLIFAILTGPLGQVIKWIVENWDGIVAVFEGVVQGIVDTWNGIVQFFVDLWNNVINGIANFILSVIQFFQDLPNNIVSFFSELPTRIGYVIGFLLGTITKGIYDIGVWLFTNVPIIINNFVTFWAELPGKIITFLAQILIDIALWLANVGITMAAGVVDIVNTVTEWFGQLPAMVGQFFEEARANIENALNTAVAVVTLAAQNIWNGIVNTIQNLPQIVGQFFTDMGNNISNIFNQAVSTVTSMASSIYNTVTDWLGKLPGTISDIFWNCVDAMRDVISSAISAVTDFASGIWEGFKDGLGINSPSYIEHAMWAITGVLETETERMRGQVRAVQRLGNGISEVGNHLGDGFSDNLNGNLVSLYDQLKTVQTLQDMAVTGSGSFRIENAQALAIAGLSEALDDLTIENNYDIEVNNPVPEEASKSIPKSIRRAQYQGG